VLAEPDPENAQNSGVGLGHIESLSSMCEAWVQSLVQQKIKMQNQKTFRKVDHN
jgi:hypothetical protein